MNDDVVIARRSSLDRLLRVAPGESPPAVASLVLALVGAAVAGLLLGGAAGEPWLALFAAIKVPLLLELTALIVLPSFFVLNAVLGLRDDFERAWVGIFAAQATLAVTLGALSPLFVITTLTVDDPHLLTLTDAAWFTLAALAAQSMLARHYAPLIARQPMHRVALRAWLVVYAFTGIQMAWVLRPFRGTAGYPIEFLRPEAFEQNAWLVVLDHFLRLFR